MAIYHGCVNNMQEARKKYLAYGETPILLCNDFLKFREVLENTAHTFVFVATKNQYDNWMKLIDKYGLKEYISFEMPYFVSNRRYPGVGRKLRLVIFTGKGTQ